ncbi:MAG: hypothetical protein OSA99_20440 [Acidimicrobiales bacterium]|nr:hypothetical protein [Acidimicrobiales bacterium]
MSPAPPDAPKQSLAEVLPQIQTGDILVFHCDALESRAIDAITDSWFSHAAMAVVHPGTGQRLIWQTDPGAIVEDPHTHSSHSGAQLGDLDAAVEETAKTWGDQPYWRALHWDRPSDFDTVVAAAIDALEQTPYPSDLGMVIDYLLGREDVASSDGQMFCSQLIAATYQRIGLLDDEHPSDHYRPKDFSSESGAQLSLQAGAVLAAEVEVML